MLSLFAQLIAQLAPVGWGVADIAIAVVIVVAIIGLVWVFLRQSGVAIPGWFSQVLWIVVAAVVVIVAIRFVAGL